MVETAGNKLRRARLNRHMSLEDAARATKIRAHQLAALEVDDYSSFANLAYARSFLANYSKFLRVDLRDYLEGFSDNGFGLEDYQYLRDKPLGQYRIPYRRHSRARRPQRRQLIAAGAGIAALVLGVLGWMLYVNIQRLGDLDKLAARQEAREKGGREMPMADSAVLAPTVVHVSAPETTATSPAPVPGNNPTTGAPVAVPATTAPTTAPTTSTPAPSVAPAEIPAQDSIPALATNVAPVPDPVSLPSSDDRQPPRELLTAHAGQPQTQKVVNDRPRGR